MVASSEQGVCITCPLLDRETSALKMCHAHPFPRILAIGLGCLALAGCTWLQPGSKTPSASLLWAQSAQNPGVFDLADATGFAQVVAVSDVHGMVEPLQRLLTAGHLIDASSNWSGGRTLLIIDGDSIDKGPHSIDVLDLWMKLQQQAPAAGGELIHVLGNHEAEFLADPKNSKAKELLAELRQRGIPVADLTDPAKPRGGFLHQMPLAAKVGKWLFCHAGLYPDMTWSAFRAEAATTLDHSAYQDPFLAAPDSILEAKDWWTDATTRSTLEARLAANGIFGVVQGHQPSAYRMPGRVGSIDGGHLIKIDNGMAPEAGSHPGHLLRFPHPGELNQASFPHAEAIAPDGTIQAVVPEALPPQ